MKKILLKAISVIMIVLTIMASFQTTIFALSDRNSMPTKWDSRDYNWVTSVKNQLLADICWAHAITSTLETDAIVKNYETKNTVDFSESYLVWFSKTSSGYSEPFKGGGTQFSVINGILAGMRIADESDFPYTAETVNNIDFSKILEIETEENAYDLLDLSKIHYSDEDKYKDNGYTIDSVYFMSEIDGVKKWVLDHGSCTVCFCYEDDYLNSNKTAKKYSYYLGKKKTANHMVSIVGWDDNYSKSNFNSNPGIDGAWLCKNSYGASWGDYGYFWLSYADSSIRDYVGFEVGLMNYSTSISNARNVLLANDYTLPSYCYASDFFEIEEDQILAGVGYYSTSINNNVDFQIVAMNEDGSYGETVAKMKGSNMLRGYTTIRAQEQVILKPGKYLLQFKTSSGHYNVTTCGDENFNLSIVIRLGKNEKTKDKLYDNSKENSLKDKTQNMFINNLLKTEDLMKNIRYYLKIAYVLFFSALRYRLINGKQV